MFRKFVEILVTFYLITRHVQLCMAAEIAEWLALLEVRVRLYLRPKL